MSLHETDAAAEAVAVAPRVRLQDIESAIAQRYDFIAGDAIEALELEFDEDLAILSICLLRMQNGFIVIGKSAPASPENFNKELGCKLAYEDAVRQLWPLMGFALRDKLMNGGN